MRTIEKKIPPNTYLLKAQAMKPTSSKYKHDRNCSPLEAFVGTFYASRDLLLPSSGS